MTRDETLLLLEKISDAYPFFLKDRDPEKTADRTGYAHIAFSVGSAKEVDRITGQLREDGFDVLSGPRITGDGYYESCIVDREGNQIEITV